MNANDIIKALQTKFPTAKVEGKYLRRIPCPQCNEPEAFTELENPFVIICPRENHCGAQTPIKEILDNFDYGTKSETTANEYMESRAINVNKYKHLWKDGKTKNKETNEWFNTVKFEFDGLTVQRLIDYKGKNKVKIYPSFKGKVFSLSEGIDLAEKSFIWIVEGIIDAISLHQALKVPTIATLSSTHLPNDFYAQHKESNFVIAFDGDKAGLKAAAKHIELFKELGINFKYAKPPTDKDWNDLLQSGELKNAEDFYSDDLPQLEKKVENVTESKPTKELVRNGKEPIINISRARLSTEITQPTIKALLAKNDPPYLFNQETRLMRLSLFQNLDGTKQIKLTPVDRACLLYEIERAACFVRSDKYGDIYNVSPPEIVASDILNHLDFPDFPKLETIVTAPCVTKKGRTITNAGYDKETGIFYFQDKPLKITQVESVTKSKQIIDDVLVDFPFTTEADKENAISLMLLPFVLEMIDDVTPFHFFTAPVQRSGKTLLAKIIASVFNPMVSIQSAPEGKDAEEEWRKKITASLMNPNPHVFIDNVKGIISSSALEGALTSRVWTARLLGSNREATMRTNKVWIATGNNAELSTDMTGRTIEIRIDPNMEDPSARSGFKHANITKHVEIKRGDIIGACLFLIQNWIKQGKPKPDKTIPHLGGFENYREIMGGIMTAAGYSNFLGNRAITKSRVNHVDESMRGFVSLWWEQVQNMKVRAKDLHPIGKEAEIFDEVLTAKDEAAEMKRLGRWLQKNNDRVFNGLKIRSGEGSRGKAVYWLEDQTVKSLKNIFPKPDEVRNSTNSTNGTDQNSHDVPFVPFVPFLTPTSVGENSSENQSAETTDSKEEKSLTDLELEESYNNGYHKDDLLWLRKQWVIQNETLLAEYRKQFREEIRKQLEAGTSEIKIVNIARAKTNEWLLMHKESLKR